jgi:hypothetical protein
MTKAELKMHHELVQMELAQENILIAEERSKQKMERLLARWEVDDSAWSHNFIVRMING